MNSAVLFSGLPQQRGLSIVEVMVAMTLSLILTAGVVQVFVGSKNTYRVNDAMSRLQEDGRVALEFLSRDIRMAAFQGCSRYGPVTNTLNNASNIAYDFAVGVIGYDNLPASMPTALTPLNPAPTAGTDVVVVRRQVDNPVRVVQNNNGAQLFVEVTSTETGACADGTTRVSGICQGDILMVSDCRKSRIFQTGNIQTTGSGSSVTLNVTHPASGSPGNAISSWGGSSAPDEERFSDDAEIVKVATYIYYIANNADGIPALYRQDGTTAAVELAQGVENLQVLYGIDNSPSDVNQSADVYSAAGAVTDWDNVVSVRLHLLMRTVENAIAEAPQTYRYVGTEINAATGDRYIRKEFTALVALRNRLR